MYFIEGGGDDGEDIHSPLVKITIICFSKYPGLFL